jgi:ATP-dependent DNA helicase RecG
MPAEPPLDDDLVDALLRQREGPRFETKRVGDNAKKIQSVVAFANTEGGLLVLGLEDEEKAEGRDRVYGIEENAESVDELQRLLGHRVTPTVAPPVSDALRFVRIGCTLRTGARGSVVIVQVPKSTAVHSVVDGGTYVRYRKSNRQISAAEITELAMRRGTSSVVTGTVDVPFDLLDTRHWREYAAQRRLTRPIAEAMRHLGLAREEGGALRPTRAAVLLFAEEPGGLLDSKCAIRIFHYKGDAIERTATTNLVRTPRTVGGPLIAQIAEARKVVLDELASGVQVGPLGFEIAQRYPVRVIQEAITNAVIHRDYRLPADIHVRIFADRIEVESPGVLPGNLTVATLGSAGSRPRNRALVDHLREFPVPPNLDAGEGVPMMRQTMEAAELYPPLYSVDTAKERVVVQLSNEERPSIWTQVEAHLDEHGDIGNAEVRALLRTDDPVRASRLLKSWLRLGLLVVANPEAAKQFRRYQRPETSPEETLFSRVAENTAD